MSTIADFIAAEKDENKEISTLVKVAFFMMWIAAAIIVYQNWDTLPGPVGAWLIMVGIVAPNIPYGSLLVISLVLILNHLKK